MSDPIITGVDQVSWGSRSRWTEPADELPLFERPAWQAQAACRGMDTALFFPTRGELVPPAVRAACGSCPVRAECLDAGMSENGIWAGTSERERQRLRREQPTRRHLCDRCGMPFDTRSLTARWCGDACRRAVRTKVQRGRRGE